MLSIEANEMAVYGYKIVYDGTVTLASTIPTTTIALELWLFQMEKQGLLIRVSPRWPDDAIQLHLNQEHEKP